jgi:hypothetical protein
MRPDQPPSRSQVLDHLGLVAGMFDELGIGEILDQAPHHNPELRALPVGEAVNAMVRNGLGWSTQARSLVPRCFDHTPTDQLVSPRVTSRPLNDAALGRAVETLEAHGVTARDSLLAATAAERLGLAPRGLHRDTTSVHVDGRSNRDEAPAEPVVPSTRG